MVRALKAPHGDFRDWEEIRGWARAIAQAVDSGAATEGAA